MKLFMATGTAHGCPRVNHSQTSEPAANPFQLICRSMGTSADALQGAPDEGGSTEGKGWYTDHMQSGCTADASVHKVGGHMSVLNYGSHGTELATTGHEAPNGPVGGKGHEKSGGLLPVRVLSQGQHHVDHMQNGCTADASIYKVGGHMSVLKDGSRGTGLAPTGHKAPNGPVGAKGHEKSGGLQPLRVFSQGQHHVDHVDRARDGEVRRQEAQCDVPDCLAKKVCPIELHHVGQTNEACGTEVG